MVIVLARGPGPGTAAIGGLDETGVQSKLTRKGVAAVAAIDVAGNKGIEDAVYALLAAGLPSRVIASF